MIRRLVDGRRKIRLDSVTDLYDDNGNRTHVDGNLVDTYDDQVHLLAYVGATYTYTINGERKSKTEGGLTSRYE